MSGVFGTIWRLRPLLWMMTRRDLAARFKGTAFGVFWIYAQPVMLLGAYYFLFDIVFSLRLGDQAPVDRLGIYLVVGMVPWLAFVESISRGSASLVESASLLQKNALPPELFPARAVLASSVIFLPLLLLLVPLAIGLTGLRWTLILLPLIFLMQVLMSLWLALLLSVLAAAMRDVLQTVTFAVGVGVFLSPVLYPLSMVPEMFQPVWWINPMTAWVLAYQDVLLAGQLPSAGTWIAMLVWLGLSGWLAHRVLRRAREQVVDWL